MFKPVRLALRACFVRLSATAVFLAAASLASAQYCAPVVNATGLNLNSVQFAYSPSVVGGVNHFTGSSGYSQTVGSSSGTVKRYWGSGIWYNIQNSGGAAKAYRIRLFADWNSDGDFNDFLEDNSSNGGTVAANSNLGTGLTITPILSATGNIRIRVAMCEGTTPPTPCGSFTGEVEDYILTIATNAAPVLDNSGTPFINTLLTSQTNAEGFTINQLIGSTSPDVIMAADADDAGPTSFVPRGLAIYGQNAANGTWQYKIGAGAWTAFGAVSASNALVLIGDGAYTNFQPGDKIRFVPTGAGTADFSYRLWDGTSGANGGYANITATGGTTAFSTATETASVNVVASIGSTLPVFISTQKDMILNSIINRNNGNLAEPNNFLGTNDDYFSADMTLTADASKLYWIAGSMQDRIASSNADGGNVQTALISGIGWGTGLAVSPSHIFYMDWSPGIYRTDLSGANLTPLTGGAGQLSAMDISDIGDIEYANNKIYFVYGSIATGTYRIMSANTDGTSPTELYSSANYPRGLYVTATQLYWTEQDFTVTPNTFFVKKKLLSGGSVQTLATQTDRLYNDLIADETNATIYVVVTDGSTSGASEIRKVATGGGAVTTVLSINGMAISLAFDNGSSTLPVNLTKYEAKLLLNKTAELSWAAAGERGNSHFVIEKSSDGQNFTASAAIRSKGDGMNNYTWIDAMPAYGTNYYRLKQVDTDGKIKDLGTRRVMLTTPRSIEVYPNPVTGNSITVNMGYDFTGLLPYQLVDATGRTVLSGTITQQQQVITTGKLAAGYYILALADGQRIPLSKKQ